MSIFEIQGPDGKVYEVEAPTIEQAASAVQSLVKPGGGSSVNLPALDDARGKYRALGTGIASGMSLGFGDNIAAGIGGVGSAMRGDGFRQGYDETLDIVREGMGRDAAANPGATMAGNLVGTAIPAIMAGPLATGKSLLGTMGRGGAIGATEGALLGAGNADGQDVAGQAMRGGLIGAAAGVAAPAVVAGGAALKNAAMDPVTGIVDAMLSRASTGKANRAAASALRDSGRTEADLIAAVQAARAAGQPEYRLMDALGIAGQRQASGVARAGGDASREITEFLERRQLDQGDRVGGFIDDAFGTGGTTAAKTRTGLDEARQAAADIDYPAARSNAGPVNLSGAFDAINDALRGVNSLDGGKTGLAETAVGRRLESVRNQLTTGNYDTINFDEVLETKQELGRAIASMKTRGEKIPPAIAKVYGQLDAALADSSDLYRTANRNFAEASGVIDAVDTGASMAARGRAADNVPAFTAMPGAQQDAARVGYGDALLNRLEAVTAPTANRAKPLMSTKRTAEADAMARDPSIYRDRLTRENEMWETQNRALGGSRTADNLQDVEAIEGLAGGALGVARSAGNLQFGDMAAKIGALLGPIARGQTDETRQLIARILMSEDPAAALAPVLRQQAASAAQRRVAESLIRQPLREGGLALTK